MTPETITRLLRHRDAEWWPEGLAWWKYADGDVQWVVENITAVSDDFAETILIGAMVQWLDAKGSELVYLAVEPRAEGTTDRSVLECLLDAIEAEDGA